jgi:hypothetical protein
VVRLEERREHTGTERVPSLSAPLTALVGRASELQALSEILRKSRLVTLTSPARPRHSWCKENATSEVLQHYLADRGMLLLLDNCEHVLDACVELAAALLRACSGVRILATSRKPLGITGEAMWSLGPLLPQYSYRLFLERPGNAAGADSG